MDWKSIIGVVAPTLATALGGPLAGLAVESIGKVMGMDQPTVDKVKEAFSEGSLTAEQITQLKQAEDALAIKMRELDITEQQLYTQDTQDARKLQASTNSIIPALLTCFVVGAFTATLVLLLNFDVPATNRDIVVYMIGQLSGGFSSALAFWFGTTRGSSDKSKLLAQAPSIDGKDNNDSK